MNARETTQTIIQIYCMNKCMCFIVFACMHPYVNVVECAYVSTCAYVYVYVYAYMYVYVCLIARAVDVCMLMCM